MVYSLRGPCRVSAVPVFLLAALSTLLSVCSANQYFYQIPLRKSSLPILPYDPATKGPIAASYQVPDNAHHKYLSPRYSILGIKNNGWHRYGKPESFPSVLYWFRIDDSNLKGVVPQEYTSLSLNLAWPSVYPLNFTSRTFGYYPQGHEIHSRAVEAALASNHSGNAKVDGLLREECEYPCIKYVSLAPHLETPAHIPLDAISPVIISVFVGESPRFDGTAHWAAFYIFVLCISTMLLLFPVIYNIYVSIFEQGLQPSASQVPRKAEIFGVQLPGCQSYCSPSESTKSKEM